jgi:hypothetical protein
VTVGSISSAADGSTGVGQVFRVLLDPPGTIMLLASSPVNPLLSNWFDTGVTLAVLDATMGVPLPRSSRCVGGGLAGTTDGGGIEVDNVGAGEA